MFYYVLHEELTMFKFYYVLHEELTMFNYVLHEESSEKVCFNGVRDKDRKRPGGQGEGMRLDDFMKLREAKETNLTRDEVSLQHTATHCNTPILLVPRFRCNTLQHTATHQCYS